MPSEWVLGHDNLGYKIYVKKKGKGKKHTPASMTKTLSQSMTVGIL